MKLKMSRGSIIKLSVIAAFAGALAAFSFIGSHRQVLASAFGPATSHTGAPLEANCTACHSDFPADSGKGSVEITGVPANFTPGQQLNITVKASQADAVIYGFQLTAIDSSGQTVGSFNIPAASEDRVQVVQGRVGQNFEFLRDYVMHTSAGLTNGQFGFNSWNFQWTAPAQAVGKVDFYAASNSANSDGGPAGDYIYTTAACTAASSSSSFSVSGRVTTPTGTALRSATLVMTDACGRRRVATTSSFGNYSFTNVPGGAQYTIGVQSKRYRFAPRIVTLNANLADADFTGLE